MKIFLNKILTCLLIVSLIILPITLTGCGSNSSKDADMAGTSFAEQTAETQNRTQDEGQNGQDNTQQGETLQEDVQKFPMKVADATEYEMTIESEPKRIISQTLGSDEILMGLVDAGRILALTKYADDPGISNIAAEASKIEKRATFSKMEELIAMGPDLVIVDTWSDPNEVKQLRDIGINVYVFQTPCNIDQQKAVILELAKITGADEKGQKMVAWMDEKLAEVEEKLSKLKPEEKLKVLDYGEMGSSGKGTNYDDIVTRAGLINVVSEAGIEGWPVISKEQIIEFNPDVITLPSWYYDDKNSLQGLIDTLKSDKSLKTVKAIANDRFIVVPNQHISAISQYVVLGVEDMAKAAYPHLFEE